MEVPLCGGISKIENQSRHQEIVAKCKEHIGKLKDAKWEVIEITNTREQVVGGMKYYCEGKFRDLVDQSIYEAVITIYERVWENFIQVDIHEKKKVE